MYHTRVAPSPTGMAHLGTARTAVHNWLAAKASGGTFGVRIDDTDTERNNEAAVRPIFETFAWLGLDYGWTFRQSDRLTDYASATHRLHSCGLATVADNGAYILDVRAVFNALSGGRPTQWSDMCVGDIAITDAVLSQVDGTNGVLVLSRGGDKRGSPTYQFASVYDDWDTGTTLILRGTDHQTNTPKQIFIWLALNLAFPERARPLPAFAHVGLINMNGKKMSKRDGAASMLAYKEAGYHPDALFNFLLRLGWGPKNDDKSTAIITRDRAIDLFLTGGRLRASPAGFDQAKLDWLDKQYKRMDSSLRRRT